MTCGTPDSNNEIRPDISHIRPDIIIYGRMFLSPWFANLKNMWLVLYPTVHGKARPDITHIPLAVIYIRSDMCSSHLFKQKRQKGKIGRGDALRPYLSGTSRKSWYPKIGLISSGLGLLLFLFLSFCLSLLFGLWFFDFCYWLQKFGGEAKS